MLRAYIGLFIAFIMADVTLTFAQEEIVDRRTLCSKTYRVNDTTFIAEISPFPIHYQDSNERWQDINTSILPYKDNLHRFACETNVLKAYFGENSAYGVKINTKGNNWIAFKPVEMRWINGNNWQTISRASNVYGKVNNDSISYERMFMFTDMKFIMGNGCLKCKITLSNLPSVLGEYEHGELALVGSLERAKGLSLWVNGEKQTGDFTTKDPIEFRDSEDRTVYVLSVPIFYEKSNRMCMVSGEYRMEDGMLYVEAPISYLKNMKVLGGEFQVTFPLNLDGCAYRYTYYGSYVYEKDFHMYVGRYDYLIEPFDGEHEIHRGYVEWETEPIPDYCTIARAEFTLTCWELWNYIYMNIRHMKKQPSQTALAWTIWDDCGDGTIYTSNKEIDSEKDYTFTYTSGAFITDLENSLSRNWFAIGCTGTPDINQYCAEFWAGNLEAWYVDPPPAAPRYLRCDSVTFVWEIEELGGIVPMRMPPWAEVWLSWISNTEPDLWGYYVYRRKAGSSWKKVGTTNSPSYHNIVDIYETYWYYVTAVDEGQNESEASNVIKVCTYPPANGTQTAGKFDFISSMFTVSPNPIASRAKIQLALLKESRVTLSFCDVSGKLVDKLGSYKMEAGYHTIIWTPKDLPSGIYFAKLKVCNGLETENYTNTKKLILLR